MTFLAISPLRTSLKGENRILFIRTLVIGNYLELACLPVGGEFGYWDLEDCAVISSRFSLNIPMP